MTGFAVLLAILALVVAIAAYRRTGGVKELSGRIEQLSANAVPLRDKAADTLDKLSGAVRQKKEDDPE